jgi:hypothetical protein
MLPAEAEQLVDVLHTESYSSDVLESEVSTS